MDKRYSPGRSLPIQNGEWHAKHNRAVLKGRQTIIDNYGSYEAYKKAQAKRSNRMWRKRRALRFVRILFVFNRGSNSLKPNRKRTL